MRFDRRIVLFAVLSAVCFALTPLADDKYAYVPPLVGVTYAVLTVVFLLDWIARWFDARSASDR